MQIKLNARLAAAAALVLEQQPMADIGTDHAYLPAWLVSSGKCPQAIASDVAEGPYRHACAFLAARGLESRVEARLGDGLSTLQPGEAATVCLCGMGGYLICKLLAQAPDVLAACRRLVLQPQKNPEAVRQWLSEHHWRITDEKMALDRGFFYPVLAAEHGEMKLSQDELAYGPCLLQGSDPLIGDYLRHQIAEREYVLQQLSDSENPEVQRRKAQLLAEIAHIRMLEQNLPHADRV